MFDELRPILPCTAEASREGDLLLGGVDVGTLAEAYGTPVIVYDAEHVRRAAQAWLDAFANYPAGVLVAYASKAFASVGIVRMLAELGLGADVASEGELAVALRAGVRPELIVVHGNNKSTTELAAAVDAGVGLIVVDAEDELELLARIAGERGMRVQILVRVNPDIAVETHRYISTSHAGSKFGVSADVAERMLLRARDLDAIDPLGVHVHLGSQLLDVTPWTSVLDWLGDWAVELRDRHELELRTVDVGGGLGIAYAQEQVPPPPSAVADAVSAALDRWVDRGLCRPDLVLEPGRSVVGSAAITLYRVGVVKETADDAIRYVNVDCGMSDNPRPVLYQARYRALLPQRLQDPDDGSWWVAGVHCESGDVLIEDAVLPHPRRGDLLAVPATGAYAASMASTYNQVPRCAVVLVDAGTHRPLLRRETLEELLTRDVDAQAAPGR